LRSQLPRVTPSAPPPRAAIYARVSSDQQAERHTIDSQLSELTARVARDGHPVPDDRLFVDNGHSGASLVRPALERLRDLVALAAVDILYVHAPDRLARSYAHQVLLLEEFARAGTEVVFLNRPIGDTPEDSLLLQLQGMFAEYERAKVLERSRRGKRHRAQAGAVSVLSRAPFGYRYVTREAGGGDARYEIDESAARVVRQIFAWVGHERLTLAAVCRRLHAASIPSPSGKAHWSRAMIHTMLLNPAYAGRAIYGRRRCVPWQPPLHPPRGHGGLPKRPFRQVPAAADQHIGVPVPAIVDEALFASAAEQLEENRRRSRERLAGVRYLLRGLLVCRKCGYSFTGHHHRGRWRYYRCCGTDRSRFHGQFRCDARLVAVEPLDTAVWDEVCRLLKDPARVLEEYQRRLDAVQANPRRLELDVLERQIVKTRRAIDRLIDGYAEGLIEKPEFEPRIAERRSRAARLEAEAEALRAAEEQVRSLQLVISKLGLFATMVRDRLETADWSTMRDIICTLVRRIEVADDAVRVVFRVDPGSSGPSQPLRRLPHCPTRRGQLARHRHDGALHPAPAGDAHAPSLQAAPLLRAHEQRLGALEQRGAHRRVATLRHAPAVVGLARRVPLRGQAEVGSDQARLREPGRDVHGGHERQRDHGSDAGGRHEPAAERVVTHEIEQPLVQHVVLRLQRRVRLEQRQHDRGQALTPLDQLADARAEAALTDHADPQAEVLQRAPQVRLEVEQFGLQQLAGGQQQPALLAHQRLDVHRAVEADPHYLRDPARIVTVRLVALGGERAAHVLGLDADHRQAAASSA
jgi:site-specific DNA recombinase